MIRNLVEQQPFHMWVDSGSLWVEDSDHIKLNLSLLDPSAFNDDDRNHFVYRMLLAVRNNRTPSAKGWVIEQRKVVTSLLDQWGE